MLSKGTLVRYVAFVLFCQYLASTSRLTTTGAAFMHINPIVGEAALAHLCSSSAIGGRSRQVLPAQHGCNRQCRSPHGVRRKVLGPVFSATESVERETPQLSEIDARVLNELLSDPAFIESLREQGLEGTDAIGDTTAGTEGESGEDGTEVTSKSAEPLSGSLAVAGKRSERISEYESATMQVVEELQESVRGLMAKLTATVESAGIYISNRAQMDAKVVTAVVNYASKQAVASTGKLLLAATGAASPAFQLMGINATDTQESLNVSLQLMSLGVIPDSLDTSPKMLPSLKDFDNDDKRLSAAYRRQRRLRSKPLPAKVLGALPSTLNKAVDLAYEVEQEVKYERAGSRANKLLRPFGLLLPEARDASRLLGGPDPSREKMLEGSTAENLSTAINPISSSKSYLDNIETPDEAKERRTSPRAESIDERRERRAPMPPTPDPFGVWKWFSQTAPHREEGDLSPARVVPNLDEATPNSKLAAALVGLPHLLAKELSTCLEDGEKDLAMQERSFRAADAVLCCTEPVIIALEEGTAREYVLLDQVKSMARTVQQQYVLAEINEAVEAAEAHIVRLELLATNVMELAASVRTYMGAASERTAQMVNMTSRFQEAKTVVDTAVATGEHNGEGIVRAVGLLQEFDANRACRISAAGVVDDWLITVRQESPERALDDAGRVHEDALLAAARLWEVSVSAFRVRGKHASAVDRIANEIDRVAKPSVAAASEEAVIVETEEVVPSNTGRLGEPEIAGVKNNVLGGIEGASTLISDTGGEVMLKLESITADDASREDVVEVEREQAREIWVDEVVVDNSSTASGASFVDPVIPAEIQELEEPMAQVEVVRDAFVVSESVARTLYERTASRQLEGEHAEIITSSPTKDISASSSSARGSIALVIDENQSFVDTEAEVEDDISDPTRVGIKVLDVIALLVEKVLFVGLPTALSSGALVWERLDNVVNGAKGRKGWRLLKRFKKDWSGYERGAGD